MITGAAESFRQYSYFSVTDKYFIMHLEDITIYFKKRDRNSFLINDQSIITFNTTMVGKSLSTSIIDAMWMMSSK